MDKLTRVVSLLRFLSIATITICCLCNANLSAPCKQNERQSLLTIKKDLKDPSNKLSSWVGEGDCCRWIGVICDNVTGHVHELHLGYYYSDEYSVTPFGGKLNPSLLNLTHLSYLDLSRNDFEGTQIPSFLGSMKSLRYLNLSAAWFGGIIPHELGNLSSLRSLDLKANNFVVEDLQWISGLSLLQHLNLSYIDLSKVSDWSHVTNTLPSLLVEFHMAYCELHDIPSGIANMTSLKVLHLAHNYIDSTIPVWLYNLTHLESLDLQGNSLHGEISSSVGNLTATVNLYLSDNQLEGKIPNSMGNLCKLMVLDLSRNKFSGRVSEIFDSLSRCSSGQIEWLSLANNNLSGHLSHQLGNLKNLRNLDISSNSISGAVPVSLGNLSYLENLHLEHNPLEGVVSEVHFSNLTRLKFIFANENSLTLKVSPAWIPPFQLLTLCLSSWHLEPSELPSWLQTQTQLFALNLTNTGISGTIPTWFWNFSSYGLLVVDLSYNQLYGEVPNIVLSNASLGASVVIILGSNQFNGSLPHVSSQVTALDLSNSSFSGTLFHFFCDKTDGPKRLSILQLHNNLLAGEIPDCLMNVPYLRLLNLENNNLTGSIPRSPVFLQSLHLRNNHLSGELPTSLQNCEHLFLLDLSENKFVGMIPAWIGKSLSTLGVLSLRSNKLHGNIPNEMCNLANLQILDLAHNNLSGAIPSCFYNFTTMANLANLANFSNFGDPIVFSSEAGRIYGSDEFTFEDRFIENEILVTKGRAVNYIKTLTLVTLMDLSNNIISGEIPEELTSLICLQSLNLSNNLLTGRIPSKIGDMRWLECLDLSMNQLSGHISPSLSNLTFLAYLNLSYNYLIGEIPTGTQLQSFAPSSYIGNKLCGPPLEESCSTIGGLPPAGDRKYGEDHGGEAGWLYLSLGLGFAFGFWSVLGSLLLNMPWSNAFSRFQNIIVKKLYDVITERF